MDWNSYTEARPEPDCVCEWRMPHAALDHVFVLVLAKMRKRGAGYTDTYSPPFDYWDGYRVHVPFGLQWRYSDAELKSKHSYDLIGVEDLSHCECPFCGKAPTLKAMDRNSGGVALNPDPHRLNNWWLECCSWGKTPHYADPRQLEAIRREAFARLSAKAPVEVEVSA